MKLFAFFALFALLIAPAAHAQTDPRVQILKSQVEGFLENQKAMALKNGCKLDMKGAITVEKAASGYYALTLPHITYTDSKGIRSEIGMVAINAIPQGAHDWKISIALPTPISSFTPNGAEQFKTDIGTQNASGIWNENLGHFTSVTSNYSNIQMHNLVDQSTITIGSMTFNSNLAEQDADAWTGSASAALSNIGLYDAATSYKGTLPSITMSTNLADRASKTPMTKEQIKTRPQAGYPDFFNVFSFMFGTPEVVQAKITGLDAISMQLSQNMITAKPAARQEYLKGILAISAISGMGKPVPGDAASKSYDILFGKDGNVTINGTALGSLTNVTAPGVAPLPKANTTAPR